MTDGKAKLKLLFDSEKVYVLKKIPTPESQYIVTTGVRERKNGLYKFRPPRHESVNSLEAQDDTRQLLHSRLGHASWPVITFMIQKSKALGLPTGLSQKSPPATCHVCCLGKQCRKSKQPAQRRPSSPGVAASRASEPLTLLHTDLCGPMPTESLLGSRYLLTITDDHSRFT